GGRKTSAKNYVWSYSYSPSNNISTEEELLSYNVSNRTESLSISPKKGKPGEEVAISGSFPEHPNEDVRIWIPETGDEYSVTADGNGDFSLNIDIPIASDRTPSPGEMGSIGVIAELRSNPKDAYAVSTLVIEEIVLVDITSPAEGALLMDSDVTVEWGSEKADYHEVRLDGDAWEDVGADTSHTFDLADGGHTVEVKATDEDANQTEVKTATDIVNFTVDSTPPEIEITSPEEGAIINSEELTVEWTGDGGEIEVDHYEIRTDDNNWIEVGMDTNYTFAALTDGDHSVEVKAQDKEGRETISGVNFTVNTEAQIDVQDFSVDPPQGTSPLTVDITAQISNEGNSNGTVELSAGDETINTWQLEPGQSESVNESYTLEEIGDHNITLGSEQVTVTVLDGPELVVVDLTLPDTLVEEGDTETIEATVRNDGGMDGTAFIYVADKQIAEEVIPAGDEVNFSAEYTFNEDGEINIDLRDGDNNSLQSDSLYINEAEPSFDVTGLEVEDTGSELEITVGEIENNGSAEGTISLEIIQDGEVIYTVDNWTLEAGDSVQDVQKTYEYDESGDYTVKVGEESEDISVETGAAGSSGDDTPGFTLAILLMSMIFALLAYHRKDQS
ncbi:MAG: hypothetical protein KGY76_09940, partial [Candidatus Thermoplasmatota archaeon]|nr:hypothetical protein [Candidatus Thermoplasmatota archaeon]